MQFQICSVHRGVLAGQRIGIYLFITPTLCVSAWDIVSQMTNVCFHNMPTCGIFLGSWTSQGQHRRSCYSALLVREVQEVESYSAACVHFFLSRPLASMLTWGITLWQKTENRFALNCCSCDCDLVRRLFLLEQDCQILSFFLKVGFACSCRLDIYWKKVWR